MISLPKLFGKDQRFYDLLEASAAEARTSATLLTGLVDRLRTPDAGGSGLEDFASHRRKDKQLTRQLTEELCRTFVTPLDREDIEALAESLYKIPKMVNKIGDRLTLFPIAPDGIGEDLRRQTAILEKATAVVETMIKQLRQGMDLTKAGELNAQLQRLEGEADKLMLQMFQALFQGDRDVRELVLLKDIAELVEKAIDRCRDAGNTVFLVVLKHT
jgi:uncharacterized protein Yka (UPF0111/DUF47 family)